MNPRFKSLVAIAVILLISGCTGTDTQTSAVKTDPQMAQEWLVNDAKTGFTEALKDDYARLTIISGSLNKLNSATNKERTLGVTLGAIEATIFPSTYEYRRLNENENIPVELKRDLAPPGLLKVLNQNYITLESLYNNILKPLADLQENEKELQPKQKKVLDRAIEDMNIITRSYGVLSKDKKPSLEEIQQEISIITKAQNEIEKMGF